MQDGHKQFFNYILDAVAEDKVEEAKTLLLDNFEKQNQNLFTKEDIDNFTVRISNMLKLEKKDEVMSIMNQFGNQHISK